MIVNPLAFRIDDFILRVAVLELLARSVNMRVVAAVLEGALALALVEQATRYLAQSDPILLTKVLFRGTRRMEVGRDDKVASLPADWARSEVMLSRALVIGGTPRADTLQAEDVIAAVEYSKLTPGGKHTRQANLTLSVVLSIEGARLRRVFLSELVRVRATIAIPTAVRLEEHANFFLGLTPEPASLPLAREKLLDPGIVLIVRPLAKLISATKVGGIDLSCTNGLDDADLARHRVIAQNDPLTNLPLRQLIIILKVVWVVLRRAAKVSILLLHWWHLGWCTIELICHVLDAIEEEL